jgi:hypothetical protein
MVHVLHQYEKATTTRQAWGDLNRRGGVYRRCPASARQTAVPWETLTLMATFPSLLCTSIPLGRTSHSPPDLPAIILSLADVWVKTRGHQFVNVVANQKTMDLLIVVQTMKKILRCGALTLQCARTCIRRCDV